MSDAKSDSSESDSLDFSVVDICPLEAKCNPSLDGVFDQGAVLERVRHLSASELAALSEICMCSKGCKYKKTVDSDNAAREDKIARHEAKIASWQVGKKAGCFTIKGKTLGGKILLSPADGKGDKGAMREFYKNVRSKPKGKSHKGRESSHVSNFG